MKKNDILLFICIIACSLLVLLIAGRSMASQGTRLEIYSDNTLYGSYDLFTDKEININDTNICVIKDGKASMKEADCPDHICVKSGSISRPGESIICIPNRISLMIKGGKAEYDTVVK